MFTPNEAGRFRFIVKSFKARTFATGLLFSKATRLSWQAFREHLDPCNIERAMILLYMSWFASERVSCANSLTPSPHRRAVWYNCPIACVGHVSQGLPG